MGDRRGQRRRFLAGTSFWITLPAAGLVSRLAHRRRFLPAAIVAFGLALLYVWKAGLGVPFVIAASALASYLAF